MHENIRLSHRFVSRSDRNLAEASESWHCEAAGTMKEGNRLEWIVHDSII